MHSWYLSFLFSWEHKLPKKIYFMGFIITSDHSPLYSQVPMVFLLCRYHKWITYAPNTCSSAFMGDFMTFAHSCILLQYLLSCVPLKFISLLHFSHQHAHILFSHPTLPLCYCTFLSLRVKLSNSVDCIHYYWFIPYQCWTHLIQDFTSSRLLKILFSMSPMASTFLNQ